MMTIVMVAVVLSTTAVGMHRTRKILVTAPYVVLIYGLFASLVFVGFSVYGHLQEQREFDQCEFSVTRSEGNRAQHLAIAYELRRAGLDDIADRLVEHLDVNLPERSMEECG